METAFFLVCVVPAIAVLLWFNKLTADPKAIAALRERYHLGEKLNGHKGCPRTRSWSPLWP